MPHAWIGAEFVRALRSLFVYERESDQALVIAAGIPQEWLSGERGVGVKHLPTWFGTLEFSLRKGDNRELLLDLGGVLSLPPGRIVVRAPADRPLREVMVNGKPIRDFNDDEARVGTFPAEVVLRY